MTGAGYLPARARWPWRVAVLVGIVAAAVWVLEEWAAAEPSPSPSGSSPSPSPTGPGVRPPPWPWPLPLPPGARPRLPGPPSRPGWPGWPTGRPQVPGLPGLPGSGSPDSPDVDGPGGLVGSFLWGVLGSASREMQRLFARLVLTTPQLTGMPRIRDLWQASWAMALTAYVLLVVLGGVLIMAHGSVQSRYAAREMAPRIGVGLVAAAMSLLLVGWVIRVANALALGVFGDGVDLGRAAATLVVALLTPLVGGGWVVLFLQLIGLVMLIALLATYIIRVIVTILLIVSAPLALACHASPVTEGIAMTWWRLLGAVVVIEVGQSLALVTSLRVLFNSDGRLWAGLAGGQFVNLLITLCLLYVMIKIPVWAFRMALQRTGHHQPLLVRVAMYAAAHRFLRAVTRVPGVVRGGSGSGRLGRLAVAAGAVAAGAVTGGTGAAAVAAAGAKGAAGKAAASKAAAGRAGSRAGGKAGAQAAGSGAAEQGPRRAGFHKRIFGYRRTGGSWRRTSRPQGQSEPPKGDTLSAPRWAADPARRWTPPDPSTSRRIRLRGGPEPDSDEQRRRWGTPNSWTPPYAGPWRQPPRQPSPPPGRRGPASSRPRPNRPWAPPGG